MCYMINCTPHLQEIQQAGLAAVVAAHVPVF